MKTFGAMCAAACVLGLAAAQPPAITAFTNVSIVPMDRAGVFSGMTVLVQGDRITAVGAGEKPPARSTIIDGTGKFLMPALAEMHAHVPGGNAPDAAIERVIALYAANGLATIRGMLGHPRHLELREKLRRGDIIGPELFTSGPSFNGQSAPTPAAAVQMVLAQKQAGYDFLKIHPGLSRATFDALAEAATGAGITFSGHVPADVGLARALEAKYRTIDHLDGYVEALAPSQTASDFFGVNLARMADESKLADLVAHTKAAGTWMVPTQNLMENVVGDITAEALKQRPEMRYESAPAEVIDKWVALKEQLAAKYTADERRHFINLRRRIILALHKAGVPFLLGVDAPQMWNVPGFSTHRELQSLVAAGLTPFQALQTGTVNVATFFGREATTGTIAAGKTADLLLLDGNPLADIANTSKISGVMLKGRYYTHAELLAKTGMPPAAETPAAHDRRVVLVTIDGLRWQEVFGGADEAYFKRDSKGVIDRAAARYAGASAESRRAILMPFMWNVIASQGQILGDPSRNSVSRMTNGLWFSYPGYNELLAGVADPRIDSNAKVPNPNTTVLEWLNGRPGFERKVAAFGSWDVLPWILNTERSGLRVGFGFTPVPAPKTERQREINELARDLPRYWDYGPFDAPIVYAALDSLRTQKPRVLYVLLGEGDEWAHEGRYDLYLEATVRADRFIERIWNTLQSIPEYRNNTTLLVTTDHGRGATTKDWTDHGRSVPAAERTWIAALGPAVPPSGVRSNVTVTAAQIAATIAAVVGEDFHAALPKTAPPLPLR